MSVRTARVGLSTRVAMWAGLVAVEGLFVAIYFANSSARILEPRYVLYPFVWINLGLWAIVRTPIRRADRRTTAIAATIALGYFLVLGWLTGLVSVLPESSALVGSAGAITVNDAPPGWGPRVTVATDLLQLVFVPYRVVGYAALAVLVYDGVVDAAASTVSGVAGLFSCLGCAFPVVSSILATLGGSSALIVAVRTFSVDISTLVFVLAVGLLVWRPSRDDLPSATE
jgi:hypothetical protein